MGLFSSNFEFYKLLGNKIPHSKQIKRFIDEATSELLPAAQEDLARNMDICDLIKSRQINGREAMRAIKARLQHRNPNVQLLALNLTDACVKNTSQQFLRELTSREFVEALLGLCKEGDTNGMVIQRSKELVQTWAMLLGENDELKFLKEAYEQAKREGVIFPPLPDHLDSIIPDIVKTDAPPEWTDSTFCVRCKVPFSIVLRKHHCRHCGQTFCQDCSSKNIALPEMGLYEEVRVCENCYAKKFEEKTSLNNSRRASNPNSSSTLPLPPIPSSTNGKRDTFEDDLAKAIQLSLSETNNRTQSKTANYDDEEDALAAAIAASLEETNPKGINSNLKDKSHEILNNDYVRSGLTKMLITPIERENIQLFSELMAKMRPGDEFTIFDPKLAPLINQMENLKGRLQRAIEEGRHMPDTPRLLESLEGSLEKYMRLFSGKALQVDYDDNIEEDKSPDLTMVPTRPRSRTGSIVEVEGTCSPNQELTKSQEIVRNISTDIVPVLQPKSSNSTKVKEDLLIPDLFQDDNPTPETKNIDRTLAELLEDNPLIQL